MLFYLFLLQAIFIIPMSQRQNRIDEQESRDVILHARSLGQLKTEPVSKKGAYFMIFFNYKLFITNTSIVQQFYSHIINVSPYWLHQEI